jgi:mRNA interferase MazF
MLRGEVWWAAWPNDPSAKPRPILIVSNNLRNGATNLLDVVVVKLTSLHRDDGSKKPTNPAEDVVVKFKKDTIIRCSSIYSIEKSMLTSRITQLSIPTMKEVDKRLKHVLDIN